MSNWLKSVKLDPIEFDGDSVVFTVTRLQVEHMNIVLQKYDRENQILRFASVGEMCELAATIIPQYVESVDGLKKADGTAITKEEFAGVAKEYYFAPLVGELFTQLMSVSVVKDPKKSVPPLPAQPAASVAETPAG